jgi:hypothetical protein
LAIGISGIALGLWACSTKITVMGGGESASSSASKAAVTTGTGATSGTGGSTTVTTSTGATGGSCVEEVFDAKHPVRAIDAIVVVENDFTMNGPIYTIEQQLHPSFFTVLQNAGATPQIIMISDHGPGSNELCMGPPLATATTCNGAPGNVPGQFQHYSTALNFGEPLCDVLNSLAGGTDEFGMQGWTQWLRPASFKAFLMVSTNMVYCTYNNVLFYDASVTAGQDIALDWDSYLLALGPTHFGNTLERNYIFEALVGVPSKPNYEPYHPEEPVTTTGCSFSQGGSAYQWLAKGTGALRASGCDTGSFGTSLAHLANDVIDAASDRCTFLVPDSPNGQMWDFDLLVVRYTPSGGGPTQEWFHVDDPSQCGPGRFYLNEAKDSFVMCPATCAIIEADPDGDYTVVNECAM